MAHADYSARGLALPFCPTARLASAIGALDTTATMVGFTSPVADGIRIGMAALIEAEIVVVEARSGNTLTLGRGTCDTIPAPHPANATIFFFDDSVGTDGRQYVATESIGVKPLPRTSSGGPLPRESAPPEGLTFNWRFHRPYPPGDVTINGNPFTTTATLDDANPNLALSWAHRDRIVQMDQLIKHNVPSIGPEPGTTYRIQVVRASDNSVRRTVNLGAVTSWVYDFVTATSDFGNPTGLTNAYLILESRRDGLGSWQSYRINFTLGEFVAPTSGIIFTGSVAIASNGFNSSNASFAWPAGSSTGDLGVLIVVSQPGRTISAGTAGMVLIDEFLGTNGSLGAVCRVFAKVKAPGDVSMGVTINGGSGIIAGQMLSYSTYNPTAYVDTIAGISNAAASSSIAFPAASATHNNSQVILIAVRTESGNPWFTLGASGNLSSPIEISDTSWASGGIRGSLAVVRATLPSAGPIGTVNGTSTGGHIYSTRAIVLK